MMIFNSILNFDNTYQFQVVDSLITGYKNLFKKNESFDTSAFFQFISVVKL